MWEKIFNILESKGLLSRTKFPWGICSAYNEDLEIFKESWKLDRKPENMEAVMQEKKLK